MEKQIRTINTTFEIRKQGEGESRAIGGIAAMVNTPTVLWESEWNGKKEIFKETILPGAFDDVMNDDVRALVNHNSEKILGRTIAKTLTIYRTKDGHLGYDVPDVPNTTFGNDLLVSITRGEITQSSFGFYIGEERRQVAETETEITYTREIVKLKRLEDVSPVTFPAYEQTVTEMRSKVQQTIEELRKELKKIPPIINPNDDLAKVKSEQRTLRMRIQILKNA